MAQQLLTLTCALVRNYGMKLGDPDSRSLWIILQNTVKSNYDQKLHAADKKKKRPIFTLEQAQAWAWCSQSPGFALPEWSDVSMLGWCCSSKHTQQAQNHTDHWLLPRGKGKKEVWDCTNLHCLEEMFSLFTVSISWFQFMSMKHSSAAEHWGIR